MTYSDTEAGHSGAIVSLGGIIDRTGQGRKPRQVGGTLVAAAAPVIILDQNQRRICAIIQNTGTNNLRIAFGKALGVQWWWWNYPDGILTIVPMGSFQIDNNIPWTGDISAESDLGTTYNIIEVSVS